MTAGENSARLGKPAARNPAGGHRLALGAVFAAEAALFLSAASRHVAWAFPRWSDQVQYLDEAYKGFDWMRAHGFAAGVRHVLGHVSPQGSLHGFLALLAFTVAGPSRMAALTVNLLAFVALQAATFFAVRRTSGGYPLAWAAVGLLAAAAGPWAGAAGSATDFRLDWMASCAYGVALAAAVAAGGLRSTRWAALLGAAVGIAVLTRFLTAVYFSLIFLAMLGWLATRPQRWSRIGRLMLSGACALALSGWALWRARHAVYAYYWVGHFAGQESALRDSHLGLLGSAAWLCREVLFKQVGWPALVLCLAAAASLLAFGRDAVPGGSADPRGRDRGAWAVALLFFGAPAAVLLLHPAKDPPPVSIILPAAVWIMVLSLAGLARRARPAVAQASLLTAAAAGLSLFVASQAGSSPAAGLEAEFRDVNELCDYVYFRSEEAGLTHPRIAVTLTVDALSADVFRIVGRERHQRVIGFTATLPTGLFATTHEIAMAGLAQSDFVCLVTRAPLTWPFDRQMNALLPETRAWCEGNLRHVGDLETAEFGASVFERRTLPSPAGGRGVDLARMLAGASLGAAQARATPPARPLILVPARLLWTTKGQLRYAVKAAYSPFALRAAALPEGLVFDPKKGELRGFLRGEGTFDVSLVAENEVGVGQMTASIHATGKSWDAEVYPPSVARAGAPSKIGFGAFDLDGRLNYIDVTDLTTATSFDRIEAPLDERSNWQGSCAVTFHVAGRHTVLLRFVRYVPGRTEPYDFVDRLCGVEVAP